MFTKSTEAVEYTDSICAERKDCSSECFGYDTQQSNGEASVMLWEMWSTPLLLSLPGLLWPAMVALDRVLSMGRRTCRGHCSNVQNKQE